MTTENSVKQSSLRIYLGTFFIAFSTLAFEITLTRVFSVITFYHLAFFAVSTAMLGMTAGATTIYLKPDWFSGEKLRKNTAMVCIWFAVSVPIALIILCLVPLKIEFSFMKLFAYLMVTFACALPFYFSGMAVSLVLTKYPYPIGKLYASDLIGAALGCIFVLGGLEIFDAPALILVCGIFGVIAALFFAGKAEKFHSYAFAIVILILLFIGIGLNMTTKNGIRPVVVKGRFENPANIAEEKWNSFSRITVNNGVEGPPSNWGPSPVMPQNMSVFSYQMFIDGEAGTTLHRINKPEDANFLNYDVTNTAYYLREGSESACIIGVGGGRDIQSALHFGMKSVVGVDVNPVFIDLHKNKFRSETKIADNNKVKLVVDEARSYLSRSNEKFSIIQMSLIDTWAATGAGAFTLTENALYTTDAWKVIIDRLDDNGLYTLSRWYNPKYLSETGRVVSLAVGTLLKSGIKDPSKHIAMMSSGYISTLIISKRPFQANEISKLKQIADTLQYSLFILPGTEPSNEILKKIIKSGSMDELLASVADDPLNLVPPTDNNPYFFNMLKLNHLGIAMNSENGIASGNLSASITLMELIFSLLIMTIVTIVIPLKFSSPESGKRKIYWKGAFYFSLIGAGFMMTEIALMQRLSVFLGHPVYALGILLFTIILSCGIGSFVSDKVSLSGILKYLLPAAAAILILSTNFILDLVISSMITSPMMSKILASIVIIFPLGFVLGFFFPTGMKYVKSRSPEETPWFWALNGIFGVLFSAIAVFFSIYFGIATNFYLAAVCYALILLLIKGLSAQLNTVKTG